MKYKFKNLRIAFPHIFKPGGKYDKYGAQFRFSAASGIKEQLEAAIDEQGTAAFGAKWPVVKKERAAKGKLLSINDGADKDYTDDYYITAHNAVRPEVRGQTAQVITADDRIIYPGCRVDAVLDISAYKHDTYGPVVSVKLLSVQFRGDGEPLTSAPRTDDSDFEKITEGADAEDLA